MSRTSIATERSEAELLLREPPRLAPAERLALRLGLRLLLREERRRAVRADTIARTEQTRRTRAARQADDAADRTFEHRTWAGPTW
ncbi:hypothetical protein [uncultured Amnibacterium sp.]|uniref:hypothetical protein n=1 Tax=uncultured Amnibacterium sp. TaxID=1631851 RepID=UPI0035CACDDA